MTRLRSPHARTHGRRSRLLSALAVTVAILVSPLVSPASADDTGTGTTTPVTTVDAPATIEVIGAARVGETLTAEAGTWAPAETTVTYQWFADDVAVIGALEASLTLSPDFLAQHLRVEATGTVAGSPSVTITSSSTSPVEPGLLATTVPVVAGALAMDETLTATTSPWSPLADLSFQWLRDGAEITDATTATHTLTALDVGTRISVRVAGTSPGYQTAVVESDQTPVVPSSPFTRVPTPTIAGSARVGSTLSAAAGTWVPTAAVLFRWFVDGIEVADVTGETYVLAPADLGKSVTVEAVGTATGLTTTTSQRSSATPSVTAGTFTATPVPEVSGTARVGSLLTAKTGTWAPVGSLAYQWKAGGTTIVGATKSTYTPAAAVQGKTITVTVTASALGYTTKTVTSRPTAAVAAGAFTTVPTPVITGTVRVGSKLTVTAGAWAPAAGLTYQWKANGKPVVGATKSTYTLTSANLGSKITVTVTGVRAGYVTRTKTSTPTSATSAGVFTAAPVPTVTGTARVGSTLTAAAGSWAPSPSISYQWRANGAAIAGAQKSTYVLTVADHTKRITVTVTGKRSGWTSASRTSAATAQVTRTFATAPVPVITGSAQVGSILTAKAGTWSGSPALTYQWLRSGKAIAGATRASYTVVKADLNTTLSVKVTATRALYVTAARTSAKTAKVTPQAPAVCTVKGNRSSSGEWIYHVPGGQYYAVTVAEECFATEAQAVAAGYRKSKR